MRPLRFAIVPSLTHLVVLGAPRVLATDREEVGRSPDLTKLNKVYDALLNPEVAPVKSVARPLAACLDGEIGEGSVGSDYYEVCFDPATCCRDAGAVTDGSSAKGNATDLTYSFGASLCIGDVSIMIRGEQ